MKPSVCPSIRIISSDWWRSTCQIVELSNAARVLLEVSRKSHVEQSARALIVGVAQTAIESLAVVVAVQLGSCALRQAAPSIFNKYGVFIGTNKKAQLITDRVTGRGSLGFCGSSRCVISSSGRFSCGGSSLRSSACFARRLDGCGCCKGSPGGRLSRRRRRLSTCRGDSRGSSASLLACRIVECVRASTISYEVALDNLIIDFAVVGAVGETLALLKLRAFGSTTCVAASIERRKALVACIPTQFSTPGLLGGDQ